METGEQASTLPSRRLRAAIFLATILATLGVCTALLANHVIGSRELPFGPPPTVADCPSLTGAVDVSIGSGGWGEPFWCHYTMSDGTTQDRVAS